MTRSLRSHPRIRARRFGLRQSTTSLTRLCKREDYSPAPPQLLRFARSMGRVMARNDDSEAGRDHVMANTMTLSRGNGHGRVDGAVVGDVGGLAAQDGTDDADEVIGDVIEDELLGFPFGHFAFEIVSENRFVGADGARAKME